jgi:hypothetical protein
MLLSVQNYKNLGSTRTQADRFLRIPPGVPGQTRAYGPPEYSTAAFLPLVPDSLHV